MTCSSFTRSPRIKPKFQPIPSPTSYIALNSKYQTPKQYKVHLPSISNPKKRAQSKMQSKPISKSLNTISPLNPIDTQYISLKQSIEAGKHVDDICSICKEQLNQQEVALTTCHHIFHFSCLQAFRNLSLPKTHKCPICRSEYSFEKINAEKAYLNACAIKIQKVIRGFLFRRKLEHILQPNTYFYQNIVSKKAKENNTKLIDAVENQNDVVDAILTSINQELEWSRSLMKAIEVKEQKVDWNAIRKEIKTKGIGLCPICLRTINNHECAITSCKHCFHIRCLDEWNEYCIRNEKGQKTCPVCRSFFQTERFIEHKRKFELQKLEEDCYAFHII